MARSSTRSGWSSSTCATRTSRRRRWWKRLWVNGLRVVGCGLRGVGWKSERNVDQVVSIQLDSHQINASLLTATRNPQPATRNPQPATRNPQPATHNPQTRNSLRPLQLLFQFLRLPDGAQCYAAGDDGA